MSEKKKPNSCKVVRDQDECEDETLGTDYCSDTESAMSQSLLTHLTAPAPKLWQSTYRSDQLQSVSDLFSENPSPMKETPMSTLCADKDHNFSSQETYLSHEDMRSVSQPFPMSAHNSEQASNVSTARRTETLPSIGNSYEDMRSDSQSLSMVGRNIEQATNVSTARKTETLPSFGSSYEDVRSDSQYLSMVGRNIEQASKVPTRPTRTTEPLASFGNESENSEELPWSQQSLSDRDAEVSSYEELSAEGMSSLKEDLKADTSLIATFTPLLAVDLKADTSINATDSKADTSTVATVLADERCVEDSSSTVQPFDPSQALFTDTQISVCSGRPSLRGVEVASVRKHLNGNNC